MEVNSVEAICEFLISRAFWRCLLLDDLCRLSVSLTPTEPSLVQVSVSDTGIASTWEEFQELKCRNDPLLASKWDGVLYITTTGISDEEVYHLKYDSRQMVRLSSTAKNGSKFSGTGVSFSVRDNIDRLTTMISIYIQKMLILNAPKIAVEVSVGTATSAQSQSMTLVLENAYMVSQMPSRNVDHLKLGLENYVSKQGSRTNFKFGTGMACRAGRQPSDAQIMEVAVILSNASKPESCFRSNSRRTEVLYYRDFSPFPISQSSLDALTSIEWKNYGLVLKSVSEHEGLTFFEWENLPPGNHIDIALHTYHKQLKKLSFSSRIGRSLTKRAVKLAFNELKENGVLFSERASKIQGYAPDLARTISGLILSSNDVSFKGECMSLLGLNYREGERSIVEDCIKDQIVSIIARDDMNPRSAREGSSLFLYDSHTEAAYMNPRSAREGSSLFLYDSHTEAAYISDEEYDREFETYSH